MGKEDPMLTLVAWLIQKRELSRGKRELLQKRFPEWATHPPDTYEVGAERGRMDGFQEALDFITVFLREGEK